MAVRCKQSFVQREQFMRCIYQKLPIFNGVGFYTKRSTVNCRQSTVCHDTNSTKRSTVNGRQSTVSHDTNSVDRRRSTVDCQDENPLCESLYNGEEFYTTVYLSTVDGRLSNATMRIPDMTHYLTVRNFTQTHICRLSTVDCQ